MDEEAKLDKTTVTGVLEKLSNTAKDDLEKSETLMTRAIFPQNILVLITVRDIVVEAIVIQNKMQKKKFIIDFVKRYILWPLHIEFHHIRPSKEWQRMKNLAE